MSFNTGVLMTDTVGHMATSHSPVADNYSQHIQQQYNESAALSYFKVSM
jgi:hypothetical protein